MRFPLHKNLMCLAAGVLLIGCDRNTGLIIAMSASFEEQFTAACGDNDECKSAVGDHGFDCFDDNLARAAIAASAAEKRQINSKHILKYQHCVATKAGTDHWAEKDMPELVLQTARK